MKRLEDVLQAAVRKGDLDTNEAVAVLSACFWVEKHKPITVGTVWIEILEMMKKGLPPSEWADQE